MRREAIRGTTTMIPARRGMSPAKYDDSDSQHQHYHSQVQRDLSSINNVSTTTTATLSVQRERHLLLSPSARTPSLMAQQAYLQRRTTTPQRQRSPIANNNDSSSLLGGSMVHKEEEERTAVRGALVGEDIICGYETRIVHLENVVRRQREEIEELSRSKQHATRTLQTAADALRSYQQATARLEADGEGLRRELARMSLALQRHGIATGGDEEKTVVAVATSTRRQRAQEEEEKQLQEQSEVIASSTAALHEARAEIEQKNKTIEKLEAMIRNSALFQKGCFPFVGIRASCVSSSSSASLGGGLRVVELRGPATNSGLRVNDLLRQARTIKEYELSSIENLEEFFVELPKGAVVEMLAERPTADGDGASDLVRAKMAPQLLSEVPQF